VIEGQGGVGSIVCCLEERQGLDESFLGNAVVTLIFGDDPQQHQG
jgi:hypothetical protein